MPQNDDRMGAFDAVMFGVEDDPLLRTCIILLTTLDTAPDLARIVERTERFTRQFPRLRQRVVGSKFSPAPPRWETDPHFDLGYHIRWSRLTDDEAPISSALHVAEQMSEQDFDRSRPLWELAIVTDLVDGQSVSILKIHHSITDGMGGLAMIAALFDLERDPAPQGPMPDAPEPDTATLAQRFRLAAEFEAAALADAARGSLDLTKTVAGKFVTEPLTASTDAVKLGQSAVSLLTPHGKPISRWMTERSLSSTFTLIELPLPAVRAAAKEAETTVNAVFITAIATAMGEYHRNHGYQLDELRLNMPVNIRKAADDQLGNHWVPARFPIPTGQQPPAQRLAEISELLDEVKQDPTLELSTMVYKALVLLPTPVTTLVAGSMMKGVDVAATNVPGPPIDIFLCGAKVTAMAPFAPRGGAAMNIGLMSYAGKALIGINSDPAAVEDPREFTEQLRRALGTLIGA